MHELAGTNKPNQPIINRTENDDIKIGYVRNKRKKVDKKSKDLQEKWLKKNTPKYFIGSQEVNKFTFDNQFDLGEK